MLGSWPVSIAIGTVLGFLSGLGVGGGSLLILWLTLAVDMDPVTARGINLLFFLPAAGISLFFRWKQGSVDKKKAQSAIVTGCLTAAAGLWLLKGFDAPTLKKLFGGLLILTGVRELLYRPRAGS